MARETQTDRLDRIENKLDKLSEAIVSLARAEEKISQMEKFLHQQMEMLVVYKHLFTCFLKQNMFLKKKHD